MPTRPFLWERGWDGGGVQERGEESKNQIKCEVQNKLLAGRDILEDDCGERFVAPTLGAIAGKEFGACCVVLFFFIPTRSNEPLKKRKLRNNYLLYNMKHTLYHKGAIWLVELLVHPIKFYDPRAKQNWENDYNTHVTNTHLR